jgi:hypothetical protein
VVYPSWAHQIKESGQDVERIDESAIKIKLQIGI